MSDRVEFVITAEMLAKHRDWRFGVAGGVRIVAPWRAVVLLAAGLSWNRFTPEASRADLTDADLTGAVLEGADLAGAVLAGADLTDADLAGAVLEGADLTGAVLAGAVLAGADLTGADLADADLTGADLAGAKGCRAPKIESIDAAILAAVELPGHKLEMGDWHSCGTTHCRGGWAVHLAGEAGYALQDRIGVGAAASLIYAASRPGKPIPNFYGPTNAEAMDDMRAGAADAAK